VNSLKALVAVALVGISLLFAGLTIGAFAHLNPDALPPGIPLIRDLEGGAARATNFLVENNDLERHALGRGFAYMGIAIILTGIAAALVAETTSQTLPRPGRRGA
jgi:hypothetical protein